MYTKLFSSIVHSTIWREDSDTCKVWVTMLAIVDSKGCVWASVPGLADLARVDIEVCRRALARFQEPDHDSRSKVSEGRRIEEIDGGWWLINHEKFDKIKNMDERREQVAAAVRRHRAKQATAVEDVIIGNQCNHEKSGNHDVSPSAQHSTAQPMIDDDVEIGSLIITGVWLALWCNAAIAARWGEQVDVLTHGSAMQMAADLVRDAVPAEVVRDSIFRQCRESSAKRPPGHANYFRKGIGVDWEREQARRALAGAGDVSGRAVALHPDLSQSAGALLVTIKKMAVTHQTQGSGAVSRIARQDVAKLGERVLAAFDAVGGAESILGANGQAWSFLVRDFGKALHG